MAQVSAFVNTSRSRVTAYLKAMEDMKALQVEFNALGGIAFTNSFDFFGEGSTASTYDMTQSEYNNMLLSIGELIAVFDGGAITASTSRQGNLYKGKV